jgi:nitrate/TMAO reductase-like tetraheme cytochrome c subunit
MTNSEFPRRAAVAFVLCVLPALVVLARAEAAQSIKGAPASFTAECSSCHMAYPPSLTGKANWRGIMAGLDKHYGVDASIDSKTQQEISTWLLANAATSARQAAASPEFRITRSDWFIRKHEEVSASVWKRASIKSASNCGACHSGAARGDFDEDGVRIPR